MHNKAQTIYDVISYELTRMLNVLLNQEKMVSMDAVYCKTEKCLLSFLFFSLSTLANAGSPVWTFTPLTATSLSVPSNNTATVQYKVTNQSNKTHTLSMQSIPGVSQITTGVGVCDNPFVLVGKGACTLTLQINGSQLAQTINDGPVVCEQGSTLQCYRPAASDILQITKASSVIEATITVTGSPLTMTTNGTAGSLTVNNTSLTVTATNIVSNFTGTALDGNVTESGNTCASVAPQSSCTLSYLPGSSTVPSTEFIIQGSNTNATSAVIQIDTNPTLTSITPNTGSAAGGAGVTLTGTALTGATGITFGGSAATSVNVVNSTTVTAVTPIHAVGAVDVVVSTPNGNVQLNNGYTYQTTAVGQSAYGGTIACLGAGFNHLIAATVDNSNSMIWGATGLTTGATSFSNGAANTTTIVNTVGEITPNAATICDDYQVDSLGHSPCQSGNTCYIDWFLPAGGNAASQQNCLYDNRGAIGGFVGGRYWSSTEGSGTPDQRDNYAWNQSFNNGFSTTNFKSDSLNVRCVRVF